MACNATNSPFIAWVRETLYPNTTPSNNHQLLELNDYTSDVLRTQKCSLTKLNTYLNILFNWSSTSLPGNNGRPALANSTTGSEQFVTCSWICQNRNDTDKLEGNMNSRYYYGKHYYYNNYHYYNWKVSQYRQTNYTACVRRLRSSDSGSANSYVLIMLPA